MTEQPDTVYPGHGPETICDDCGQYEPCEANRLADALDAARADLRIVRSNRQIASARAEAAEARVAGALAEINDNDLKFGLTAYQARLIYRALTEGTTQ